MQHSAPHLLPAPEQPDGPPLAITLRTACPNVDGMSVAASIDCPELGLEGALLVVDSVKGFVAVVDSNSNWSGVPLSSLLIGLAARRAIVNAH